MFSTCQGGGRYKLDTTLTLFDNSCNEVEFNDDACFRGSEVFYTPSESNIYFLKVDSAHQTSSDTYILAFKDISLDMATIEPKLDNGIIELRLDLSAGGAISWLSKSGEARNIINNYDRGRQVQQSYYAGNPINRRSEGQHANWSPWRWNPIQAGDVYGNAPIVLDYSNNGDVLYVKTRPLLWDMNNEQAECDFEMWVRLEKNAVFVQNKISVFRTDNIWVTIGADQELPAVYTIGDLYKLYTYQGEYPFSQDGLTEVVQYLTPGSSWAYWRGTEKWAAHVDETNWGLGIYKADSEWFAGGYYGTHGGGAKDASTGYISPLRNVVMDKNTILNTNII